MRALRSLVTLALASLVGIVPSCASMGGGGMKYLLDPSTLIVAQASA